MIKSAVIPVLYAIVLLAAGVNAYFMAPPQASAATALIAPGAMAAVMLIVALFIAISGPKGARVAHLTGVLLVITFTFVLVWRAIPAMREANEHQEAAQQWEEALEQNLFEDTPEAKAAYFEQRGAPDHDKMYLAFTLFGLSAASALTFVLMLATPPRKEKRLVASDVRTPAPEGETRGEGESGG